MSKKRARRYIMSVLTYYRWEWTDVPDDDDKFQLVVTKELGDLILCCMHRGVRVSDAAKDVQIFLNTVSKVKNDKERSPEDDASEPAGSAGEDSPEGV